MSIAVGKRVFHRANFKSSSLANAHSGVVASIEDGYATVAINKSDSVVALVGAWALEHEWHYDGNHVVLSKPCKACGMWTGETRAARECAGSRENACSCHGYPKDRCPIKDNCVHGVSYDGPACPTCENST